MWYVSSVSEMWTVYAVVCQKEILVISEPRTEISLDKFLHKIVDISTDEHGNATNTKHLSIAVRIASLKLLKGGRDIGETGEEDIHDGHWGGWNWVAWHRGTIVE